MFGSVDSPGVKRLAPLWGWTAVGGRGSKCHEPVCIVGIVVSDQASLSYRPTPFSSCEHQSLGDSRQEILTFGFGSDFDIYPKVTSF